MALSFSGASQCLTNSSALVSGYPCSFACWYNPVNNTGSQSLISIGSTSVATHVILFSTSGILNAKVLGANATQGSATSLASLTTGTWNHCVGVFSSASNRICYLNGVSTSNTNSVILSALNQTSIGSDFPGTPTPSSFANGSIAYPSIWNIALTPTDAANLYNAGSGSDPNVIKTANLLSLSYLQSGPPYIDVITAIPWTVTGSPIVVADPFTLTPTTTSVFPVTIDTFKRIPTPATTATNLADAFDDTLSTRLQKHSDAIVATETYVFSHKNTPVNILDFGADPTGVSDSTTAIQNACNVGGMVFFPAGTYKISNTINLNVSGVYYGCGPFSTYIKTTSATAPIFFINFLSITLKGFNLSSTVTVTSGFFIASASSPVYSAVNISDIYMVGAYGGIQCRFNGSIQRVLIYETINAAIQIDGRIQVSLYDLLIFNSTTPAPLGIYVSSCMALWMTDCDVEGQVIGLYLDPAMNPAGSSGGVGSGGVDAVFVTSCVLESTSPIICNAISNFGITHVVIESSMLTANTSGIGLYVTTSTGGWIDGIQVNNCHFTGIGATAGIQIDSGAINVRISNCNIGWFINGINLNTNTSKFQIIGNRIGPFGGYPGNSGVAIDLVGNNTECIIANNILTGNTGGEQSGTCVGTFVNTNNI